MLAAGMLGAVFGAGGTLAYFEYTGQIQITKGKGGMPKPRPTPSAAAPAPAPVVSSTAPTTDLYHQLSRYGLPSQDTVFIKDGFISSFDAARRIPRWVMELITPQTIETKVAGRSHSSFYSNTEIAEPFRATNADYSAGPGLSRGHMAPAQFHRQSQTAMDATFDLSLNAVPQDMAMNASDWLRVEQLCKKAAKEFERLYVVTGPLFVPKSAPPIKPKGPARRVVEYEVIGTHDVAVPTHLFKAILAERKDGSTAFAAFVVPNKPIAEEKPLVSYLVPKEQLEKWSGLTLFSQAHNAVQLCATMQCEASAGGFGSTYRAVARLRAAPTRQLLDQEFQAIVAAKHGNKVEDQIMKEYETQKACFGG
jgi:DNA/RNA endonuclease G (NUC1)